MIAPDRALLNLVEKRPTILAEFAACGFGAKKADNFWGRVLAVDCK